MLKDIKSYTIKYNEDAEKLQAIIKLIEKRTQMANEEIDKENEIFSNLDEKTHKNLLEVNFFLFKILII